MIVKLMSRPFERRLLLLIESSKVFRARAQLGTRAVVPALYKDHDRHYLKVKLAGIPTMLAKLIRVNLSAKLSGAARENSRATKCH